MSFGTAYATKKHNKKCMARGGSVKGVHEPLGGDSDSKKIQGSSAAGAHQRFDAGYGRKSNLAHREHQQVLAEMKSMPGPTSGKSGFAEGGEVDEMGEYDPMPEENESANMEDADMIARIMHKRNQYAKGGEVANDVGVAEADKLPAEFDDLVLDDNLEDDSGAGNEEGDSRVHDDMVDRIMLKKKKDKLPRPA